MSCMQRVANKPIMLTPFIPRVAMLSVVILSVFMLNVMAPQKVTSLLYWTVLDKERKFDNCHQAKQERPKGQQAKDWP
jgi:hypothetical protein